MAQTPVSWPHKITSGFCKVSAPGNLALAQINAEAKVPWGDAPCGPGGLHGVAAGERVGETGRADPDRAVGGCRALGRRLLVAGLGGLGVVVLHGVPLRFFGPDQTKPTLWLCRHRLSDPCS